MNSDIPVYHVLHLENNADSRDEVELDEKTSTNAMDKYSVVDVSKKGNKIQGKKNDTSKSLKMPAMVCYNAIMPISVIAIFAFLCLILLLMTVVFAITFTELNIKTEASVNNFHSSVEDYTPQLWTI